MSTEDTAAAAATTSADIGATANATESMDPAPAAAVYAWAEETWAEETWEEGSPDRGTPLIRRLDGRVIPAALAAAAIAAVSVAATLMLTTPRRPDRFTIRPAPVVQSPPPAAPKAAAPPAAPVSPLPAPPAAPLPAPPAESAPPTAVAAPPAGVPPDAHQSFTRALRGDTLQTQGGAGLYPTDPAAVDSEAQSMCQDLADGGSIQSYITGTLQKSPTLAPWQAAQAVHQAIRAYCPQYDR